VEVEEEDIEPDHYYGGGKIPVFKPVGHNTPLELRGPSLLRRGCTTSESIR
jgi:hypothetical protein